ncbi:MAG: YjfB family protein [Defluviitaleaceae bacterium]|nr:YjfB family protein [Defluviitaleaceae bacterium]
MDVMSIATLSMNMAQRDIMQEVNIAVMRNAMDHAEQTAQFMADMLAAAPVPPAGFDGIGGNLDILI